MCAEDQRRLDIHTRLRIEALINAAVGNRHDAGLFVGQIDLTLVPRSCAGRPRILAGFSLGLPLFKCVRLGRKPLPDTRFQDAACRQGLHFVVELYLDPLKEPIRQRLVLAGVSFDLGAIQRKPSQFHRMRQHQQLNKQRLNLRQKAPPEDGKGIVIRVRVCRLVPESDRIIGRSINLAAGKQLGGVAVNQQTYQTRQHRRMICRTTPTGVLPCKFG